MKSSKASSTDRWSQWRWIRHELASRTFDPLTHLTFVAFFFVGMFVFGPLSVWIELYQYAIPAASSSTVAQTSPPEAVRSLASLRTALLTFFPAVAATAAMQLIWSQVKALRAFASVLFTVIIVGTAMIYPKRIADLTAVSIGAALTVITFWFWWLANAKNPDLLDKVDPDDSIGGDNPNRHLSGDLKEFEA